MENKRDDSLNILPKVEEPFFSRDSVNNISLNGSKGHQKDKFSRMKVLEYIKKHYPITKYQLSKDLNLAYTTVAQICKEFEFVGLIYSKVVVGDNNRTHKELYIVEEGKNE